jgi:hypothetical protein
MIEVICKPPRREDTFYAVAAVIGTALNPCYEAPIFALTSSYLLSCLPRKASKLPISGSTASTSSPDEVEPVASFTQPIR